MNDDDDLSRISRFIDQRMFQVLDAGARACSPCPFFSAFRFLSRMVSKKRIPNEPKVITAKPTGDIVSTKVQLATKQSTKKCVPKKQVKHPKNFCPAKQLAAVKLLKMATTTDNRASPLPFKERFSDPNPDQYKSEASADFQPHGATDSSFVDLTLSSGDEDAQQSESDDGTPSQLPGKLFVGGVKVFRDQGASTKKTNTDVKNAPNTKEMDNDELHDGTNPPAPSQVKEPEFKPDESMSKGPVDLKIHGNVPAPNLSIFSDLTLSNSDEEPSSSSGGEETVSPVSSCNNDEERASSDEEDVHKLPGSVAGVVNVVADGNGDNSKLSGSAIFKNGESYEKKTAIWEDDNIRMICHEDFDNYLLLAMQVKEITDAMGRGSAVSPTTFIQSTDYDEANDAIERMKKAQLPSGLSMPPTCPRGLFPWIDGMLDHLIATLEKRMEHFHRFYNKMRPQLDIKKDTSKTKRQATDAIATKYPFQQSSYLCEWIVDHAAHPYPSAIDVQSLSMGSGLTELQVSNWASNVRKRNQRPTCDKGKKPGGFLDYAFLTAKRDSTVDEDEKRAAGAVRRTKPVKLKQQVVKQGKASAAAVDAPTDKPMESKHPAADYRLPSVSTNHRFAPTVSNHLDSGYILPTARYRAFPGKEPRRPHPNNDRNIGMMLASVNQVHPSAMASDTVFKDFMFPEQTLADGADSPLNKYGRPACVTPQKTKKRFGAATSQKIDVLPLLIIEEEGPSGYLDGRAPSDIGATTNEEESVVDDDFALFPTEELVADVSNLLGPVSDDALNGGFSVSSTLQPHPYDFDSEPAYPRTDDGNLLPHEMFHHETTPREFRQDAFWEHDCAAEQVLPTIHV